VFVRVRPEALELVPSLEVVEAEGHYLAELVVANPLSSLQELKNPPCWANSLLVQYDEEEPQSQRNSQPLSHWDQVTRDWLTFH
jgi:hypothetical protein